MILASNVKPGDWLRTECDFDCVEEGAVVQVLKDEDGLYFMCGEGQHYLDGQYDEGTRSYVNLRAAPGV